MFENQDTHFWETKPEGKWSAGQHIIHLVQSEKPLLRAMKLPNILLKWRFGTSNRPSRSFDEVINRYNEKLSKVTGVVGPFSRNMPASTSDEASKWRSQLSDINNSLNKVTSSLKDKDLDTILLPHPLMGKMTLREILMWNAYHTQHHREVLIDKYIQKP